MELQYSRDWDRNQRIYILTIPMREIMKAKLHAFDLLLDECEKSKSIADKLLALETIARRIEEAHNG